MKTKLFAFLVVTMILAMITSPALAAPAASKSQPPQTSAAANAGTARYFVILTDPSAPSYTGGLNGLAPTNPASQGKVKFDPASPASRAYVAYLEAQQAAFLNQVRQLIGRAPQVVYQLQYSLNAVVLVLTPGEAMKIARIGGVQRVEPDVAEKPDTDVGPQWIGAPSIWNGTATGGLPGTKGEGVLVGVLDTGINMDHPSFAATGGDGYVHTNPFGAGNYKGWCNPGYPVQVTCNAKLVGAWDYADASWGETGGPEDTDGHGSHTASTAAGNHLNPGTVVLGTYPYSPAISGVAPHANIIAYDVCGTSCYNTDVAAALNQAILDGVDVTNESIGISGDTWTGAKQAAYLSVFNAGITSSRSAGNSGPGANTIGTTPPWVITVAANTHNRAGVNAVTNLSGGSTTPPGGGTLTGLGLSGASPIAPIVYAGNYGDALCLNPFASGTFTGKIVICDRGTNARVAKGWNVMQGGAVGMILVNTAAGQSLNGDVHHLPAVHLSNTDGAALKAWVASGTGHQGKIQGTTLSFAASNGDIIGGFSSRGPHPIASLLTPDVTNPGVDILAAYRSGSITADNPTVEYAVVSGTSMSSPHTAGSAALVKALHPTWTPAEVKSALMNTGKFQGILKEDGVTAAIPFDMGTGRVDLNNAGNASLILNETGANFAAANPTTGGDPKTLNLASLANGSCAGACTWMRTVKATRAGTWTASYITPAGMTLSATPSSFTLAAGQTQSLNVTANVSGLPLNAYAFGYVVLTSSTDAPGSATHLTVVVQPVGGQASINVTPASLSATQLTNTTTSQNLNIANTGTTALTWNIFEDATAAPDLANWSDNFDSYATGSQMHGQGGWKGWGNVASAGALTSSAQARSAPNSVAILGASDLVHEYAETDGKWVYTAWQYIPAGFTGQSYFILLNTYSDTGSGNNWSTQLCFDAAAGVVRDDVPGTCTGTTTLPLVTGQWVQIRVEIDLDLDTQAVYYNNQLLFQDTWSGHVSGGGATSISAVDLFANNATTVYYDDMSLTQVLPAQACDAPADIPWASVNPTSGTTAPGGSTPVAVTFNSTGLAVGTYTGNLCVQSNDPDPGPGNGTALVIVPLTLIVQAPTAVSFSSFDAGPAQAPANTALGLLAPAALGMALAAAYAMRRKA